jgi:hypothetical protein
MQKKKSHAGGEACGERRGAERKKQEGDEIWQIRYSD